MDMERKSSRRDVLDNAYVPRAPRRLMGQDTHNMGQGTHNISQLPLLH